MMIGRFDDHLELGGGGRGILPGEDFPGGLDGGLEDAGFFGFGDGGGSGTGGVDLGFDAMGPINQARVEAWGGGDMRTGLDAGGGVDVEAGLDVGGRGAEAGDRPA